MTEYNIDDVSDQQLKVGFWYLEHKALIRKIVVIALAAFSAVTLGYGIFGFIRHYAVLGELDQAVAGIALNQPDFAAWQARNKADNISFLPPTVIYNGHNSYDIYTKVVNPNDKWLVSELTYTFESGDFSSPTTTIYLLPKEERYLFSLANQSPRRLTEVSLKVIELKWRRLKEELEYPAPDFSLSKVDFASSENEARSWISFTATNNGFDNFWEVDWQALLYSGRQVVGINQITTAEFAAGQQRPVTMSWFDRLPRISTVEVFPLVDVLNPDITYKISGQAGELY